MNVVEALRQLEELAYQLKNTSQSDTRPGCVASWNSVRRNGRQSNDTTEDEDHVHPRKSAGFSTSILGCFQQN